MILRLLGTYPGLEFGYHPLGAGQGIGFDVLDANGEVLDFDLEGLLDGLDLDITLLFFVQEFDGPLQLDGGLAESLFAQLLEVTKLLLHAQLLSN